jgi:hypothetical protein
MTFQSRILNQAFAILIFSLLSAPSAFGTETSNKMVLGAATYKTMSLYKLANPQAVWTNDDLLIEKKIAPASDSPELRTKKMLNLVGYASKAEGESGDPYMEDSLRVLVDANGGVGLDGNLGSGRAAIIGEWQLKGSGKTMMVNRRSDSWHRNGASSMGEAVWEAAWSTLLYNELPYGAYRTLTIFTTGSLIPQGDGWVPRVVIVREDPLRPAHYVLNPDGEDLRPVFERKRIAKAMEKIVETLPKPVGYVSQGRQADFRAGFLEFIHRQAVQHGYMWAHRLVHGATTPSNAGLDGRMLDFGTFSAFDGYPQAKILEVEGYFGETSLFKLDLLKDIRDSWIRTLPKDLLEVLPSEQAIFDIFESEFQNVRHAEMLRLAGAFTEFTQQLHDSAAGDELSRVLIQIAEAGNERKIEIWNGESPFRQGTYNLEKILVAMAKIPLESLTAKPSVLQDLIGDLNLRRKLVRSYKQTFQLQRKLALAEGIGADGEQAYRLAATQIRNLKMTAIYRQNANYNRLNEMVKRETADPSSHAFADLINNMVSKSRREYWDAEPFTIVLSERSGEFEGEKIRRVLDAHTGQVSTVSLNVKDLSKKSAPENRIKWIDEIYRKAPNRGSSCAALFSI